MLGELAFALHEAGPRPDDVGVLEESLGVSFQDLPGSGAAMCSGANILPSQDSMCGSSWSSHTDRLAVVIDRRRSSVLSLQRERAFPRTTLP
jgi:hypothetical protein